MNTGADLGAVAPGHALTATPVFSGGCLVRGLPLPRVSPSRHSDRVAGGLGRYVSRRSAMPSTALVRVIPTQPPAACAPGGMVVVERERPWERSCVPDCDVGNKHGCIAIGVSRYWTRYYRAMSMTVTWTLGELLAKARKDAGMDQLQLARAIGIGRNTLSTYETGRSVPPFDVVVRLATACSVDVAWLATGVNAETASTEVEAVSDDVRPKGLEPLTFWLGVSDDALDVEYQLLLLAEAVAL